MNNETNNKTTRTTSTDIELKIRRQKINNAKKGESNVKTPRRYNPVQDDSMREEKINNSSNQAANKIPNNNQDFENQNANSFQQPSIDDSLSDEDIKENGENQVNHIEPASNAPANQEDVPGKKTNVNQADQGKNQLAQNNNVSQSRNAIDSGQNNANNMTKDPAQRKLDRYNAQKKQQNDAKKTEEAEKAKTPSTQDTSKPNPSVANKPDAKFAGDKSPSVANKLGQVGKAASALGSALNGDQSLGDAAKDIAKEKAKDIIKKKVRQRIIAILSKVLIPALPYIGLALLIIFIFLFIIFGVTGVFDDEDNVVDSVKLNYCDNVNLKWGEADYQNTTIPANEYIKYQINTSNFSKITDKNALIPLVIVLRTNLYANSTNLDSNVCYFEVQEPYQMVENPVLDEAVEESENKVFSVSKTVLTEIPIDEHFTYTKIDGANYKLYQDRWSYDKSWINSNVGLDNISDNSTGVDERSYSPFAAWYLSEQGGFDALSLIFHFVTPGSYKGNIYKITKLSSDDYSGGVGCSDISLSVTSLEKQEFIDKVNAYNSSYAGYETFKTNAGKIYDISINNNFNPEMVVIRAIAEGFSPGGSTYNFWGIGCSNNGGGKDCIGFTSFDQGVVEYINTVKKINSVSLFELQKKYAYIGQYWYNPGGSGQGGCYYFPHIRKYMTEERASEVEGACAPGAACSGASCLATIDADQNAYTRWQIEKMLNYRLDVFGISADECSEEEGEHEDVEPTELGKAVAEYAVKTFDSWRYSQGNRDQNGYVDCSSLVYRAYRHFNVLLNGYGNSSGEIYRWCEKNGKVISGSSLAAGDIIFYNTGSHNNPDHYKGIGHVELYIGNNRKFGAHSAYIGTGKNRRPRPVEEQVSITVYNGGDLFCRPSGV